MAQDAPDMFFLYLSHLQAFAGSDYDVQTARIATLAATPLVDPMAEGRKTESRKRQAVSTIRPPLAATAAAAAAKFGRIIKSANAN